MAYIPSNIRQPTHAGSWYSEKDTILGSQLTTFLKTVNTKTINGVPKCLICPHAGYRYCGQTAAYSWTQLLQTAHLFTRVVILGPSHHCGFQGCSLPDSSFTEYGTPFGTLLLDTETLESLRHTQKFKTFPISRDKAEHSIEMQLPFLKFIVDLRQLENMQIIPIVVGTLTLKSASMIAEELIELFKDSNTLFVISSDFCHWGTRFGYQYLTETSSTHTINQQIEILDKEAMQLIEHHNKLGFYHYLEATRNTICGANPIKLLLELIECSKLRLETKTLDYSQSTKIIDPKDDTSVSYGAMLTYHVS